MKILEQMKNGLPLILWHHFVTDKNPRSMDGMHDCLYRGWSIQSGDSV